MPLILGTNSIKDTGYNVANSLRFNSGSSDYLSRTPSGTSSGTITTHSLWFKRCDFASDFLYINFENGVNYGYIGFDSDSLDIRSSPGYVYVTTQKLRDPSAWYHLVVAVDNSLGTASDRVKIYLNGSRITSFSTQTDPSSGAVNNLSVDNTASNLMNVGGYSGGNHFGGYIAEFVFIDGQALAPDQFGEFDEDSGIWKPIDVSGLTFGTNGFYLDFKDSSALGNDVNGSNNFTVNNLTAIDQSTDTCTNNFCTLNPLNVPTSNAPTFSEGNLKTVTNGSDGNFGGTSTIGVSQGKWYAEFKFISTSGGMQVGITGDPSEDARLNNYTGENSLGYSVFSGNGNKFNNGSQSSFGVTWGANDIIGVALDLDNHKIYFHKNGTYMNSGDPTSGATGTGSAFNLTTGYDYFFSVSDGSSGDSSTIDANFGSPPFTISSGNTDGDGYGNFEYAVPSGYYSLNSKNLAEYG